MTSILLLLLISAAGVPPADNTIASTAPAERAPSLDALIAKLGDPRFAVREEATRQLCQANLALLPDFVSRYKSETAHESKLRLRQVIENLFMRKRMQGEVGFLGIRLMPAENVIDPGLGRPGECIYAQQVLKDFPADQAGMQDGDIIVSLDNKPISWFFGAAPPPLATGPASEPAAPSIARPQSDRNEKIQRFTQHIKRRKPGSKVPVKVLRVSSLRKVTVGAAADPTKTFDGAVYLSVPGTMIGLSPMSAGNTRGGLLVRSVTPGSPAQLATLKPRDIIVSLNGSAFPIGADPGLLAQLLKDAKPGSPVTVEVVQLKDVELTVTIGRRPVSRLNPDDLREAQERFALWWREQTGEISTQAPALNTRFPADNTSPRNPEPAVAP